MLPRSFQPGSEVIRRTEFCGRESIGGFDVVELTPGCALDSVVEEGVVVVVAVVVVIVAFEERRSGALPLSS